MDGMWKEKKNRDHRTERFGQEERQSRNIIGVPSYSYPMDKPNKEMVVNPAFQYIFLRLQWFLMSRRFQGSFMAW